MRFFTRQEIFGLTIIFSILFFFSYINFGVSLRRSRDATRRGDLGALYNALEMFFEDYGFFPPSNPEGKIVACKADNYDEVVTKLSTTPQFDMNLFISGLRPCNWGWDSFVDFENNKTYMTTIPTDPKHQEGYRYFYLSNTKRYQIYASLEGGLDEEGYSRDILERNLGCGNVVCNFGRAYATTPLDKSLEEYENELLE